MYKVYKLGKKCGPNLEYDWGPHNERLFKVHENPQK